MSEREYYLAISLLRWDLLRSVYAGEKQLRRGGQRAAWIKLRDHANDMLREGM